mgnify:CR=1 FL=1
MGGSKQTTSVKIPAWLEDAAQRNIARAESLSTIGYAPYYGPDVAGLTPAQMAAMQGTNQAASAFGVPTADFNSGMPQAQDYGGMSAYSSGSLADQAFAELAARRPGQYAALMAPFIDPITGAAPDAPFGNYSAAPRPQIGIDKPGATSGQGSSSGGGGSSYVPASGGSGGYTGLRDMFNGGGPGASGSTFSGGPVSGLLNTVGVRPVGSGGSSTMGGGK